MICVLKQVKNEYQSTNSGDKEMVSLFFYNNLKTLHLYPAGLVGNIISFFTLLHSPHHQRWGWCGGVDLSFQESYAIIRALGKALC